MRKLILSAVLFIGMGSIAFAQEDSVTVKPERKFERKTPEEHAQFMTDALDKKLSFTEDQKGKIYAINLESINKMKAHREQDKSKVRGAMKERDQEINSVLDDSQKSIYQELKKDRVQGKQKYQKRGKHWKGRGEDKKSDA
ncbi:hypothetical protein H8S90_16525 [Olivibacter sp. SDN3]|uniref:hypothetical protein n=1 Tax=Olivibacter sp. SDN3 TaxID=2764720 RepID=UPI001651781E|nr:hypothetical protein [Olivibacter sp. SDN3]QNL48390.1 hypothetical protein H8S90_16525 [Olivibacter sp. SDN3]